jgi:hypothetical protein
MVIDLQRPDLGKRAVFEIMSATLTPSRGPSLPDAYMAAIDFAQFFPKANPMTLSPAPSIRGTSAWLFVSVPDYQLYVQYDSRMDIAREAATALVRRRWDALSPVERRAATAPARLALAAKRRTSKGDAMATERLPDPVLSPDHDVANRPGRGPDHPAPKPRTPVKAVR